MRESPTTANFKFLRLEFGGDVLVGANNVGLTEQVGVLRGLIQDRVEAGQVEGSAAARTHGADGSLSRRRQKASA